MSVSVTSRTSYQGAHSVKAYKYLYRIENIVHRMSSSLIEAVDYLKENDKVIAGIIRDIGKCTLEPSDDYFRSLVKSIVYQQLAVKAARTIYNRFISELNNDLTPKNVLKLKESQFRKAGISSKKMSYLIDLSNKFQVGIIDSKNINKLDDESLIEHLTQIRGIGRWSAEMFLIFSLNRLNVLPLDDLGFKRSLMINYNLRKIPSENKIIKLSKNWGSYRSVAVWYLWQSLNKNG